MQAMKSLSEYQALLQSVMAYKPTIEWTKKLLAVLGIEWREESKWSLPLRLRIESDAEPGDEVIASEIVDADDSVLITEVLLNATETYCLQRILSAANAELSRLDPASAPLIYRHSRD
jgi:hypothetical protein